MAKKIGVAIRRADLRRRVAERLEAAGAAVVSSETPNDADHWAARREVDLIVLDLHFEGVHGDEIVRDLKEHPTGRVVPVIMLVEDEDPWFVQRAEEAGAEVVLTYRQASNVPEVAGRLLRADVRIRTEGEVEYYIVESSSKTIYRGRVADVSISGLAFRAGACDLEPDFLIDVRCTLPGEEAIVGRARVVRVNPPTTTGYGVHLQWEGFRKGDRERLAHWIRANRRNAPRTP